MSHELRSAEAGTVSDQNTYGEEHAAIHRFQLALLQEDDGTVSALVVNLPSGIGSCGDTEEEATEHVREAIEGVLEEYATSGVDIPWIDPMTVVLPQGSKQKWIIVHS